jgi:antitoxin HicB
VRPTVEPFGLPVREDISRQLREAMAEQQLTKVAMAQRMRTSRQQLDRVLNAEHPGSVTLDTLIRAADAVGRKLKVELI